MRARAAQSATVGFEEHHWHFPIVVYQLVIHCVFFPKQCVTLRGSYGKGKAS